MAVELFGVGEHMILYGLSCYIAYLTSAASSIYLTQRVTSRHKMGDDGHDTIIHHTNNDTITDLLRISDLHAFPVHPPPLPHPAASHHPPPQSHQSSVPARPNINIPQSLPSYRDETKSMAPASAPAAPVPTPIPLLQA